ncbi:MAG: lysylphosphatidylglycerol synthase transmembrane domain-containing protein [Bacteroidota bacterium]|nr:lysylphosphatidylglycerol synthase transmembrane domain-containing protein [Bacteroidota bacterium]MDP4192175.1 lysylphosphatidylglycerol synthase transmembrane domain-containing protein [Bacteroidota bacterium]MDP4193918.1 lysylphosphatidylglycerol synthase transmembrane domain-containing protein [Bacteroidota bacterium]
MMKGWNLPVDQKNNKGKRLFLLFKLFVSVSVLAYLYTSVRYGEILSTVRQANQTLILFAVILVFPNIFLQFLKWKLICKASLQLNENKNIWLSLFYGFSGGIATPFRLGEYLGRSMAFEDKGIAEVSAATLIDKLFVLITVTFVGAFSTVSFLQSYYSMKLPIAILLDIAIVLFYLGLLYFSKKDEIFENKLFSKLASINYIKDFFKSLLSFRKLGRNNFIILSATTLVLCFVYIFQFAVLAEAYSNQDKLMMCFWAGILVMFFKTIIPPITLGELGIREGASVFFLTKMGLNSAAALNASLTLFSINILIPSLIGFFLVISKRSKGN